MAHEGKELSYLTFLTSCSSNHKISATLACQDEVASPAPCLHQSNSKTGILQKIISGFITSAWQEKIEVVLYKRVKRSMIEINKILFKPPSSVMTAVKPEKLMLMLFSVCSYGLMRAPPWPSCSQQGATCRVERCFSLYLLGVPEHLQNHFSTGLVFPWQQHQGKLLKRSHRIKARSNYCWTLALQSPNDFPELIQTFLSTGAPTSKSMPSPFEAFVSLEWAHFEVCILAGS